MASNLSEEEFQRLQEQLIQLRTTNYSLDELCKKLKTENGYVLNKLENAEKEVVRANKTISRSKKMKEVEALLAENHSLQLKLQAQEDEFRLQNQTLLQELALLVASNEELEKKVSNIQQPTYTASDGDNELLRVKAENMALQEAMVSEKARVEKELNSLQESLQAAQIQVESSEQAQPVNPSEDGEFVELHNAEVSYQKRNGSLSEPLKLAQDKIKILEGDLKELIDVRLLLETERVEKQLVQGELSASQSNVQQLQEKLENKQAALSQLHTEKEQLYLQSKKQCEELEIRKEVEVRTLREHNQRLQTQLNKCQSALQETKERHAVLESRLALIQQQSTESTEKQVGQMRAELEAALFEKNQLRQQLTTLTSHSNELATNLDQVTQELQQSTKVSDKRKALLDEISTTLQQKCDHLQKEMDQNLQKYESIKSDLKNQITNLEAEVARLSKVDKELEEAKVQIQSLEARQGWLERTQQEAELLQKKTQEQLEFCIEELKTQHTQKIEYLTSEAKIKEQEVSLALHEAQETLQQQQQQLTQLQQQVNDAAEERRLVEKKGVVVTRDLRRQLAAERRRVEKLQERLRDLNSDNKVNTSLSDMNQRGEGGKDADTSSISSWSIMSGTLEPRGSSTREGSLVAGSPTNGNEHVGGSGGEADLEQENLNLVSRITALQQEKWILEERLNHLEEGSASMVDELMRKTALIGFYCMEGGKGGSANLAPSKLTRKSLSDNGASPELFSGVLSDKLSMKKFKDLLKPSGDEYTHDSHRRMQRMLEETLTKNMHLQADLEKLSHELARLSQNDKSGQSTS